MESSKRQVDPAPDSRGLPDSAAARRIALRPTHATYFPGPVLSAMQRSIAPRALSPPAVARDRPLRTAALRDALHSEPVRFPVLSLCATPVAARSEEHTSELQSQSNLVCRLLLEK